MALKFEQLINLAHIAIKDVGLIPSDPEHHPGVAIIRLQMRDKKADNKLVAIGSLSVQKSWVEMDQDAALKMLKGRAVSAARAAASESVMK